MNIQFQDLIDQYIGLLEEVDTWFQQAVLHFPDQISCNRGCTHCCCGLFDITLLDALLVQAGFCQLPQEQQAMILPLVEKPLATVRKTWPDFGSPWLLNVYPEEQYDEAMPDDDETPCLFLGDEGQCLIYKYRPMTCRLHGIPHIEKNGEPFFDEWCNLNFKNLDPLTRPELRFHFSEIFTQEQLLFRELTRRIFGSPLNELDTLIPTALLIDFTRLQKPFSG
ncbi:MAG: YkgJ family cysteine cluster protein [Trichlorobacter sp.]|nr:YkgJ family cysteine cluster protein [Trichlorobacter sp.]